MASRVAINGLGRIGRAALKLALEEPQAGREAAAAPNSTVVAV